jgi:hypothetical protein
MAEATTQINGQYLGFVDSDDFLHKQAIRLTVAKLEQNATLGWVSTDYGNVDAQGRWLRYGRHSESFKSRDRLQLDLLIFHFRLIRREVFQQVGGVNLALQQATAYDLYLRLSEVSRGTCIHRALYFYRRHQAQTRVSQRAQTIHYSQKVIAAALKRRGLGTQWQVQANYTTGEFFLRRTTKITQSQLSEILLKTVIGHQTLSWLKKTTVTALSFFFGLNVHELAAAEPVAIPEQSGDNSDTDSKIQPHRGLDQSLSDNQSIYDDLQETLSQPISSQNEFSLPESLGDETLIPNVEPVNLTKDNLLDVEPLDLDVEPLEVIPDNLEQFEVFPIGLNLGRQNVIESTLIRGLEDGERAIAFSNWLIPLQDIFVALELDVSPQQSGIVELRSPGLVTRLDPASLTRDPELGPVMSIAEIEDKFGVPAEFNPVTFSIIFKPPWLEPISQRRASQGQRPIVLEGLPTVRETGYGISALGQRWEFNYFSDPNTDVVTNNGNFIGLGTFANGSWFWDVNQPDMLDSSTWRLSDLQYVLQQPKTDYALGIQQTFWRRVESSGNFWGFTNVQRFGFESDQIDTIFNPSRRLQSSTVNQTVTGRAEPGTLVQLVDRFTRQVLQQFLVDSSGLYRFENVPSGRQYSILLYPDGRLTEIPEVQVAQLSALPGQLTRGTASLITSLGVLESPPNNSLVGQFSDITGGLGFRYGLTEDLTIGTGLVVDRSFLLQPELFFQHPTFPFSISGLVLFNPGTGKIVNNNANLSLSPVENLSLTARSDVNEQAFSVNWNVVPGFDLTGGGSSGSGTFFTGTRFGFSSSNFSASGNVIYETDNTVRWNLNSRLGSAFFRHRGDDTQILNDLIYDFGNSGFALDLGYEKFFESSAISDLFRFGGEYISPNNRIALSLGYGFTDDASGILASLKSNILPGVAVDIRYEAVSRSSDEPQFSIRFEPNFLLRTRPIFRASTNNINNYRGDGGIFIRPFLDHNENMRFDNDDEVYLEDLDLLVRLNNRPVRLEGDPRVNVTKQGLFLDLEPGQYRVDLEPAGYPIDYAPLLESEAFAVDVGGINHTLLNVPFGLSYTASGTVTDSTGNVVIGATVTAIPEDPKRKTITSITDSRGVFFLDGLHKGRYTIKILDLTVTPSELIITDDQDFFFELNLQIPTEELALIPGFEPSLADDTNWTTP